MESFETIAEKAVAMASNARHSIDISSHDLMPRLYRAVDFVSAIKALALRTHHASVRILLGDATLLIRDGHPLQDLSKRLSSRVCIRLGPETGAESTADFMLADMKSYLSLGFDLPALAENHRMDRNSCRAMRDAFDQRWEHAEIIPDFRRLCL